MKDCHIHFMPMVAENDQAEDFLKKASEANLTGGTIMSRPPASFRPDPDHDQHWQSRLEHILTFCSKTPSFHPFFWLDPTEKDVYTQISTAAEMGVSGFKCICNQYAPASCLKQFSAIAETGLPIHFHCGILFDHYVSGEFLRPLAFESLLEVRNLKFALAHVGNPWFDECILLYAKFRAAMNNVPGARKVHMYLDLTPGVTRLRRPDLFRMLFLSGYTCAWDDILWGTDSRVGVYNPARSLSLQEFDKNLIQQVIRESREHSYYPELPDDLWDRISERNAETFYNKERSQS